MKLEARHTQDNPKSTGWELYVDGEFCCYLLGLPVLFDGQPNVQDKCCIPYALNYPVTLKESPHFGYIVPHIENVPNRTDIEIHIANYPIQIRGCFATGIGHGTDWVSDSADAFKRLMGLLQKATDGITIDVVDFNPMKNEEG